MDANRDSRIAEAKFDWGLEKEELRVGTEEGRPPIRAVVLKVCILEGHGGIGKALLGE